MPMVNAAQGVSHWIFLRWFQDGGGPVCSTDRHFWGEDQAAALQQLTNTEGG